MTAHAAKIAFQPRLLRESDAAAYIGVSPSHLRKLGIPRRESSGCKFYDRADLDHWADSLPYEGGENSGW